MVEPCRPLMTIWRMRIACWVAKATHTHTHIHTHVDTHTHTDTHTICNAYCFSPATMFMRTRLNVMSIHPLLFLLINVFTHEHTKHVDDLYSTGPSSNLFLKTDTDDDHGFPQSFPNSRLRFGQ